MSNDKIIIIGGDKRELYLAANLIKRDFKVSLYGFEKIIGEFCPLPVARYSGNDLLEDASNCQAIILPLPGVDNNGYVKASYATGKIIIDENFCKTVKPGVPIYIGSTNSYLDTMKKKYNLKLISVIELDRLAILNSIPTAEGAVEIAIRELPITIHGSYSCVLGFGRVGQTVARVFSALGANVTVIARNKAQLARAYEMGCETTDLRRINEIVGKFDVIINTIPSLILDKNVLAVVSKEALIIDLASKPGGTDFEEARKLGIKAILALGLPGKVAPKTAGDILSNVYLDLLSELKNNGGA